MVDGKGGHQPLTQGRHFSEILAEEIEGGEEGVEVATWWWMGKVATNPFLKVGISQ